MHTSSRPVFRWSHLSLALSLLLATTTHALHRESPGALRLTSGGDHAVSPTRSWNFRVVFASDQDLLGTGSSGRQLFLFSLFDYDCQFGLVRPDVLQPGQPCPSPPRPYLTQLTSGPGNPDNPSINNAGTILAFDADGAWNGGTGAQAARRQVFIMGIDGAPTGQVVRLTNAADGDSTRPSLDYGGGLAVFQSTANLLGDPSAARGVSQVFAAVAPRGQALPASLLQVTRGARPSLNPSPNRGGTWVAFESSADLLRNGSALSQIFLAKIERQELPPRVTLQQITRGDGPSRAPYISTSTAMMVFESSATDLPGASDPGGTQIYSAPVVEGSFPAVTQLTRFRSFGNCSMPSISADDARVGFVCDGDPLQNGSTGRRAFVLDPNAAQVFQLTSRGDVSSLTAYLGHNFVVLSDTTDLTQGGACGRQLYVVNYYPAPGHWHAATRPYELPGDRAGAPPTNDLIGARTFELQTGEAGPSLARLTTTAGARTVPLVGAGAIELNVGSPDANLRQASVTIPQDAVTIPPIQVPGFGTLCLSVPPPSPPRQPGAPPVAIGSGILDCRGTRTGVDFDVYEDHDLNAVVPKSPLCVGGCPEGQDNGSADCRNRISPIHAGVCNGPEYVTPSGRFAPGDLVAELPVTVALSTRPDGQGVFCNERNSYLWQGMTARLRLTTGSVAVTLDDADAVPAAQITDTVRGRPFDCARLAQNDLSGAVLVGALHLFDVPNLGPIGDVVLSLSLAPKPPVPCADCSCTRGPCDADAGCGAASVCAGAPSCENHTCVPGTPLDCDDGNPCTDDVCDPTTGCAHLPNAAACDDGNRCTVGDVCHDGACRAGSPARDGLQCDDANDCTGNDRCTAGVCGGTSANAGKPCDPHDPCVTAATCNATGVCRGGAAPLGTPCGDACDGRTCDGTGICQPGPATDCDDGNPCTRDTCEPREGCSHVPLFGTSCDDADACTQLDFCRAGDCVGLAPVTCVAPDGCHDRGACDPSSGRCSFKQRPTGSPCSDGNACTEDDACSAGGVCVPGTPVTCAALDQCHLAGTCDPVRGCSHPPVADDTPCDDGAACTLDDRCRAGVCGGAAKRCDGGDVCSGRLTCDAATGACVAGAPLECDDGDPCTDDACAAPRGCSHAPVADVPRCRWDELDGRLVRLSERVTASDVVALGGPRRQQRLARMVIAARRQVAQALIGSPRRQRASLTRVALQMTRIARTLRLAPAGAIDPAVRQTLLDDVSRVAERLGAVRGALP